MSKKVNIFVLIISSICVLCLIPTQFTVVQSWAVKLVERLKNDDINDPFWMKQMSAFGALGIITILLFDFFFITQKGRDIIKNVAVEYKKVFLEVKENKKYLFILMGLYFVSFFTILRADFCATIIDDMGRQLEGVRDFMGFYRYTAELGSIFLHTSRRLMDIAPLTQFIAIFLLSLASFFAIKIFNNNKYSIFACLVSITIGICPYFLANYSFRYDAPYMSLSILVSIIPFLFFHKRDTFIFSSIIGLLIMCTSYQASSGIYITMSILCVIYKWLLEKEDFKEILKKTGICILCYAFTLLIFYKLFSIPSETEIYVDESISISSLIPNSINYIKAIISDFNKTPMFIFAVLITVLSIILLIKNSNQNKVLSSFALIVLIIFAIPLTFGSNLALSSIGFEPRRMYGIGILIALLSIILYSQISTSPKVLKAVSLICLFCFTYCNVVFSFAYGNAQAEQKDYIKFRATILLQDLAKVVEETDDTVEFLFVNNIGHANVVNNMIEVYPVMEKLVDTGLAQDRYSEFVLESMNFFTLVPGTNTDYDTSLPVVLENQYHKIQKNGNKYIITYKNPVLKVIKSQ